MNFVVGNFDGEFSRIADGLKSVMPLVKPLSLTIESLNASRFSSGVVDGKLVQGDLQLAPDTIIVVDETTLGSGTLAQKGVLNIAEVKRIAEMGQVQINIEYGEVYVDCNAALIVFSEGKSLLEVSLSIILTFRLKQSFPSSNAETLSPNYPQRISIPFVVI